MKHNGLYDPWFEHDACGVGFVVNVNGQRSHQIVHDGITILKNLAHRGAIGGDSKTGDGAGMLLQLPHLFLPGNATDSRISLPREGSYGVGMVFLPQDAGKRKDPPWRSSSRPSQPKGASTGLAGCAGASRRAGRPGRSTMPWFSQFFLSFGPLQGEDSNGRLYIARKSIEAAATFEAA